MENSSLTLPKRDKIKMIALIAGLMLIAGAGLFLWQQLSAAPVLVPDAVRQRVKSAIYLPKQLPGNYKIDEASFSVQEEDVLIFFASDGTGSRIVFTQQPKPKDLDFDTFYKEQIEEAKTLDGVQFPSVIGKTHDQTTTMLSIVTPETWVIATTRSPLSADDMKIIAKYTVRY